MIEKLKQHWFIAKLLVFVAVAGTTWKFALEVMVAPRDFQITQLRDEILRLKAVSLIAHPVSTTVQPNKSETSLMLEETGVFVGNSITTKDGRCTVKIIYANNDVIKLSVIIDSDNSVEFENRKTGDRITVDARDSTYYVDLHRVRGNIVDLEIFRHSK